MLVNNGVYQTGGETINGGLTNRVAINQAITVQSVNGPAVTTILGYRNLTNAALDIRCVYLTNNAALVGFTVTGGGTLENAGNDGSGGGIWCESSNATISGCVITGNWTVYAGGGVYQGSLTNCTISQNTIWPFGNGHAYGGGAYQSVLNNCTVISNSVYNPFFATVYGCGVYNSEATNCVIAGNSTAPLGATSEGGGAYQGSLVNCTITGNTTVFGGGTYNSSLINCIDYFNAAFDTSSNYAQGSMSYCCTIPKFSNGPYDTTFTNDPALTSVSQISPNSPCRGAGNSAVITGVDILGNPWGNPPSIGCSEPNPGNDFGTLTVGISTAYTNDPPNAPESFQAVISGPLESSVWNFGDGTLVTNEAYATHTWTAAGTYTVTLTAYNDSYPAGVTATNTIVITPTLVYYVNLNNFNPSWPYRSWSTAANTIQEAVNAANPGSLVLVTNGTTGFPFTNKYAVYYNDGMTAPNGTFYRVAITNPITVESVNGPNVTYIMGDNSHGLPPTAGCVYLTNGATLSGFTLTNGATYGGIYSVSTNDVITNCVITQCSGNSTVGPVNLGTLFNCLITNNGGSSIYGATRSVMYNCTFVHNWAVGCLLNHCFLTNMSGALEGILNNCFITGSGSSSSYGGAANGGGTPIVLNNCILSNNLAEWGGGAYNSGPNLTNCILNNCLIISNTATSDGGGAYRAQLNNCTVVGNHSTYSGGCGGLSGGSANNCIICNNYNINNGQANYSGTALTNCDTFPLPAGFGNFTNSPSFVNITNDFHLLSNSPCINAGNNAYAVTTADLDGNPRIIGGTVDAGCYEYQSPKSVISYAYLQHYNLPTDGSVDYADLDGTAFNVYQDWIAGLNPTNPASVLAMMSPPATNNSSGITVSWQSVSGIQYNLLRSTNLTTPFTTVQSNILGQSGTTSYTDTSATNKVPYFYSVGVP